MPKDDINGLFEKAEEHLRATRKSEPTITDGMLSPSAGSAPMPPRARVPRPAPPAELGSGPDSAPVFDAREAPTARLPGRQRRTPQLEDSVFPPVVVGREHAEMDSVIFRQATRLSFGRMFVLIAAAGTAVSGIIAATGAAIVNIISALHPPSNIEFSKRLDGIETRVNGDFGLGLEIKTRQQKDEELAERISKAEKAHKELKEKLVVKVKPGRGGN